MFSWNTPATPPATDSLCKLKSDITNLHIDLLSARCTVDRLRVYCGPAAIAKSIDKQKLCEIRSNLAAVIAFVESVGSI